MATKKTAEAEEKLETAATEEAVAEPAEQDPWKIETEVLIPRRRAGESEYFYVCVNDKRYYIPANGKRQKLPMPIAEVLAASLEAEAKAEDFAENMPHADAPAPKPI